MNRSAKTRHSNAPPRALGWLCFVIGLGLILLAIGIFPLDETRLNAPRWILGLAGLITALAAVMMLSGKRTTLTALCAALMTLSFAVCGGWIAIFAESDSIAGGLPFVSRETNVWLGRLVFGLGAVFSLWMTSVALRQFLSNLRATKSTKHR